MARNTRVGSASRVLLLWLLLLLCGYGTLRDLFHQVPQQIDSANMASASCSAAQPKLLPDAAGKRHTPLRRGLVLLPVGDVSPWPQWLVNPTCPGERQFDLALMWVLYCCYSLPLPCAVHAATEARLVSLQLLWFQPLVPLRRVHRCVV